MKKSLILLFCFLSIFSCYNKSSNEEVTKESVDSEYYHNLFKEYLIKMYSDNNGINELCANTAIKWKEDGYGLEFYSEDSDWFLILYHLSGTDDNWYTTDSVNPLFKGDLNGDGRDEVIIVTYQSGGGCGGNVGWPESYILYGNIKDEFVYLKRTIDNFINPPKDNDCPGPGDWFEIDSIHNGFIYGKYTHCLYAPEDAFFKGFDNENEIINIKCRLIGGKFKIEETF